MTMDARASNCKTGKDWPAFLVLILIVNLFAVVSATAQPSSAQSADRELDRFIVEMMKSAGIPGVQAVVVKGNHIVWSNSYGYAVLAQPGPLTPMRKRL